MTDYREATRGQSDIIGVEQINGKATLLFGIARTTVSQMSVNKYLVNGRWFKVTGNRNKRVASLNLYNYTESGECFKQSLLGEKFCFTKDMRDTDTLNINKNFRFFDVI